MNQAIITRYHGPTLTKGARVSARINLNGKTKIIYCNYYHGCSMAHNHWVAAANLILALQAQGSIENGTQVTGGYLGDDYVWALTSNKE